MGILLPSRVAHEKHVHLLEASVFFQGTKQRAEEVVLELQAYEGNTL